MLVVDRTGPSGVEEKAARVVVVNEVHATNGSEDGKEALGFVKVNTNKLEGEPNLQLVVASLRVIKLLNSKDQPLSRRRMYTRQTCSCLPRWEQIAGLCLRPGAQLRRWRAGIDGGQKRADLIKRS